MNTKPFDLVIFHCDGVLVDSEPLANHVFVQIVREHGHGTDVRCAASQACAQCIPCGGKGIWCIP